MANIGLEISQKKKEGNMKRKKIKCLYCKKVININSCDLNIGGSDYKNKKGKIVSEYWHEVCPVSKKMNMVRG